jgi:hypothetical protein
MHLNKCYSSFKGWLTIYFNFCLFLKLQSYLPILKFSWNKLKNVFLNAANFFLFEYATSSGLVKAGTNQGILTVGDGWLSTVDLLINVNCLV